MDSFNEWENTLGKWQDFDGFIGISVKSFSSKFSKTHSNTGHSKNWSLSILKLQKYPKNIWTFGQRKNKNCAIITFPN